MTSATAIERHIEPSATVAQSDAYEPKDAREAYAMAQTLVKSGLLPRAVQTPEAAFAIIVTGKELGLTMMQALRSVHVIEGKPALSSDLILALAKRSPACVYFQMVKSDAKIATYRTLRVGEEPTEMSFTIEQAQRAGVTGKDNWKKYPEAMLRARCISALARAVYPDVVLGIYETDELEPVHTSRPIPTMAERAASARYAYEEQHPPSKDQEDNETVLAMIRTGFANSKDLTELGGFGDMVKKAHASGEVSEETRKALGSEYAKRRRELTPVKAEPVTEVVPEGTEAAQ